MDLIQIEESVLEEPEIENVKQRAIADAIVERSFLKSVSAEENERGEFRLGELSVAISLDQNNSPILTIASRSDYLISQFQNALQKPHEQRPSFIDLPPEDFERIVRVESIDVLSYIQKRERAREEERERLINYESSYEPKS